MRTPAGKECSFFYGDYFRGREHEECRLLNSLAPPLPWRRALCETCPVPDIQRANACEEMVLTPRMTRPFPFTKQQVQVKTFCKCTERVGFDPYTGCGDCHNLPFVIKFR